MRSNVWRGVRLLCGLTVLAVVVWRSGTAPFATGVESLSAPTLLAAFGLTATSTLAAAWRWSVVARGLGVGLPLPRAVAAYYRSQLLNSTLPGGVLGDVHRGMRYGKVAGDLGGGLRAVAWERMAGQVVQTTLTVVVVLACASPLRATVPTLALGAAGVAAAFVVLFYALPRRGESVVARATRRVRADVRCGLLHRSAWPVAPASAVVVAGHVATFYIASRAVGIAAPARTLIPVSLVVMLVAAIPANVAGWGPREGAAAWAFGSVGVGAGSGVAAATAYGVMTLVAVLPGAIVMVVSVSRRNRRRIPTREEAPRTGPPMAESSDAGSLPIKAAVRG